MTMTARDLWPMLKETATDWMDDKAPKLAAALSYYTVISLAPLLIITIKVVGVFYRGKSAETVERQVEGLTGGVGGETIADIIKSAGQQGTGILATVVGIVILLFGASGVFGELQDSLNTVWEVKPKPNRGIMGIIKDRFLSLTMVLGIAFLFLLSLTVSTAIGAVSGGLIEHTIGADGIVAKVIGFALDLVLSTALVIVLFAAIFRLLPDVKLKWSDVWTGAILTAVLFQVGKYALTFYFSKAAPGSAYGAAGSLIALLVWLYYSSQILFFGAEFTQAYSRRFGSGIRPAENAVPVSESERANLGLAPGARSPGFKAPRIVRITPPAPPAAKDVKRPLIFGTSGLAAGLMVGAVGAWAYRRTKPNGRDLIAVELDRRINRVEEKVRHVNGAFDRLRRTPTAEVWTWRRAVRDFVWQHPKLWPTARAVRLERIKAS